jgi:uncharacterized membrane protein
VRSLSRLLIAFVGLTDVLAGISLLITPVWFFERVGHFAPFNQHYEGDAGAFVLAIGVGLMMAAVRPAGADGLVVVAMLASLLHLANHIYASLGSGATWSGTVIVAVQAALLIVAAPTLVTGRLRLPALRRATD